MTHPHDAEAPPCSIMIVRVAEDDQSQNKPVMARPATCSAGANLIMFGGPVEAQQYRITSKQPVSRFPGRRLFCGFPKMPVRPDERNDCYNG